MRCKTFKEYHQFYNVIAYKFRELNKIELKFLSHDILKLSIPDARKSKILPDVINEVYKVILMKNQNNDLFWQVANFLCSYINVIHSEIESEVIFKSLNIKLIEIYHSLRPPPNKDGLCLANAGISKDNIVCICQDDTTRIRMTNICYNCRKETHKKCFQWSKESFICPQCILDNYDPFYRPLSLVSDPQILKNNTIIQFFLHEEDFTGDNLLIIKCIRIGCDIESKYNEMEINFPQKGCVKINGLKAKDFKPDKELSPKRKDIPIMQSLSAKKNILKRGLNNFLCEYDAEYEDDPKIAYIFDIKIYKQETPMKIIENLLDEQSKIEEKYIEEERSFLQQSFEDLSSYEMKISLVCPLTFKTIRFPVKGESCAHCNVFCLESFLKNLEQTDSRKIKCPICNKPIFKFKIDFLILDILFQYTELKKHQELENEVTIRQNMTCYFIEEGPESESQLENSSISEKNKYKNLNKTKSEDDESIHKPWIDEQSSGRTNSILNSSDESDDNFSVKSKREIPQMDQPRKRGRPPTKKPIIQTPIEHSKNVIKTTNVPEIGQKRRRRRRRKTDSLLFRKDICEEEKDNSSHMTFSEEEIRILDILRPFYDANVASRFILDSYYDTVILQKRIEQILCHSPESLKRINT